MGGRATNTMGGRATSASVPARALLALQSAGRPTAAPPPPLSGAAAAARLARAPLVLLLRGLLSGSVALYLFYLAVVATRQWRDEAAWATFPPDFGCDEEKLLDACTLERVAYLHWLPTIAALSACCLAAAAAALSLPAAARLASQRQLPLVGGRAFWARWCGGLSRGDALLVAGVLLINAAWAASLGSRYRKLLKFFAGGGDNDLGAAGAVSTGVGLGGLGGGLGAAFRGPSHHSNNNENNSDSNASTPVWALEVMLASIALGQLLMPNLALLFFPVARGSPLLQAAGISYPAAVRAHRWLGHLTMAIASAHSLGFWGVWLARGQWTAEAFSQGARVNNLAGGLSFLGGLALWLTSLERARRTRYGLFIATHHFGWWVFFLAGVAHYAPLAWYFLPGLLLYFVDAAFRVSSWGSGGGGKKGGGGVRALEVAWEEEEDEEAGEGGAAAATMGAAVVALVVRAPGGFAAQDTGIVWVRAPAVSFWQFHPFEYVLAAGPGGKAGEGGAERGGGGGQDNKDDGGGDGDEAAPLLALHIKSYGRWSRAFAALAREAACSGSVEGLDVRLEAPYGDEPPAEEEEEEEHASAGAAAAAAAGPAGDDEEGGAAAAPPPPSSPLLPSMVVLAGGIGATAALSLLRELERQAEREAEKPSPPSPRRRRPLLLVWAARHASELAVLLPRLLDAAGRAGVDLDARLFYTGRGGLAALTSGWASAAAAAAAGSSSPSSSHNAAASLLLALRPPPAGAASTQCPVLAPGRLLAQLAQRLSAHALGCAGALAALLAVRRAAVVAPALAGLDGWTTARAGLASAAAIALGAALPALLVIAAARALLLLPRRSLVLRAAVAAPSSGGDGGGALRRPLLAAPDGTACEGRGGPSLAPRVRFVAAANGGGAVAVVAAVAGDGGKGGGAGGGLVELPVALGRPALLRGLVCDWLAAHNHQAGAPVGGGKAGRGPPPPAELYAMGPDALVDEARMLCDDLAVAAERGRRAAAEDGAAAAGEGAAGVNAAALPAVLFRLRTHEL